LWGIIGVLLAIVVIISIFDIVRRHLGAGRTAAWILLVVLLPFLGSLLYWVLRPAADEEVSRQVDLEREIRAGKKPPRIFPS
jgi:uncharacterized protein (DUF58 family)